MSSTTPATADSTPPPTTLPPPLSKATSSSMAAKSPLEPSRFIHISGIRTPRPLAELRHWFSRGHFIYDELREPVVPTAVAGAGPDRLATATSDSHPRWESTLGVPALRSAPADVEVEGDSGASAEAASGAPASASVGLDDCDAALVAVAEKRGLDASDASATVPGGDVVLHEKAKATKAELLFEAQVKTIEDVEAALALQKGEGAVAAEEEQRLIEEESRKAEIKSKTWTGSRGKYGHKKGARPHGFHGRPAGGLGVDSGRYQQQQQQQDALISFDARHDMNSYDEAAHARYTGQFDHFDPPPTPGTLSRYESYMGPDNQLPESLSTHWRMRQEYEAKVEAAQREQHRLRCERLAKYPWTWRRTVRDTTPVVSPVMSVLSPRAHEFVPAGLISPPASHSFVAPSMGAIGVHHRHSSQAQQNVVWYPAPPAPVGSTQYWLNRQYGTMSTLNPTAGEFRPCAMPPRGPKMDDVGAGI